MKSQGSTAENGIDQANQKVLFTYREKFQELTRWDTCVECIGDCGAGGAIYFLVFVAGSLWFRPWGFELLLLWPILVFCGFLAGLMSGALVSLIVMPINASLGWPLKSLWCSFIVGGLAGFVPFIFLLFMSRPRGTELLVFAAIGPIPAMLLGHVCAYLNTKSVVQDHNARFGVAQHDAVQDYKFGITQIMIFTIWVAVGFSLLSAFSPRFQIQLAKFYFLSQFVAGFLAIFLIGFVSCVQAHKKRNVSTPNH